MNKKIKPVYNSLNVIYNHALIVHL